MYYINNYFVPPRHEFNAKKVQDPVSSSFNMSLSAIDIAALKTNIESMFKVTFSYTGIEFDYTVTLTGPNVLYQKAMLYLFPKGRENIIVQRGRWG